MKWCGIAFRVPHLLAYNVIPTTVRILLITSVSSFLCVRMFYGVYTILTYNDESTPHKIRACKKTNTNSHQHKLESKHIIRSLFCYFFYSYTAQSNEWPCLAFLLLLIVYLLVFFCAARRRRSQRCEMFDDDFSTMIIMIMCCRCRIHSVVYWCRVQIVYFYCIVSILSI